MRIRLPHKRFVLTRTDHLTRLIVPMDYFWFRRTAKRAATRQPEDRRYSWGVARCA